MVTNEKIIDNIGRFGRADGFDGSHMMEDANIVYVN